MTAEFYDNSSQKSIKLCQYYSDDSYSLYSIQRAISSYYFRQAAMFKVQMNDKPNLALIKNEAQICKNSPLRLVTIMAILIMEFQVQGAKIG